MTTKPKAMKFRLRRGVPLAHGLSPSGATPSVSSPAPRPAGADGGTAADGVRRIAAAPPPGGQTSGTQAPGGHAPGAQALGTQAPRAQAPAGRPPQPRAPGFDLDSAFDNGDDGFGPGRFPTARGPVASSQEEIEAALEAISREELTGRQLRMARRMAQKHGLSPTSDFDAVRLLRERGIDPLERSNMLELVIAGGQPAASGKAGGSQAVGALPAPRAPALPQTVPANRAVGQHLPPQPTAYNEESRAREIHRIQRDIARRRRRKMAMLFVRLAVFILLPTILAGIYYYRVATPLYATKSEFLIQKADSGGGSSLGSLFAGTQFAGSQDSITVQSYLGSRDAMLRLDREQGFKAHFSQDWIDPVRRLPADASNEQAYRLYQENVKIGYDPSEGVIRLEVIAADSQSSERFSIALISYAEEQVDHMTSRLRGDQMQGAEASFADAEAKMQQAQSKVLELQERLGVLDPGAETAALMSQISGFQSQLQQKRLELQALLDNASPNQARVDGVRGDITRLETLIAELRGQLTRSVGDSASLARITGELRMAEADLQTRRAMMTAALEQLETARIEANKQVRYLALGVRPVAPDEATYPRKFENTLLAFLIFSAIYLMVSLTASILREQVSA